MPYTEPVKWELDHASLKEQYFDDHAHTQVASFHLDVFARPYALKLPQLLTAQFLDAAATQFDFDELIKS